MKNIISASILAANLLKLGEEIEKVMKAGVQWIHLDIMDNHYVPNMTMGPIFCSAIRQYPDAFIDVHLMVNPVDKIITDFIKSGANCITFHPETTQHLDRTLSIIKDQGCMAGLALNPSSSLNCIDYVLAKIDMITIMSVNPGFGGQIFLPIALKKIKEARKLIDEWFYNSSNKIFLQVDGGINLSNIKDICEAGANILVIGSAIFKQNDPEYAVKKLLDLIC